MSVSVEMHQLAAYTYLPGRMGDRIGKCGSAFTGQARARRDHRYTVTDNHTNSVLRGQQTQHYTPPGVPQAWTPRAGKTKLRAGQGGWAVQEAEMFSQSLGRRYVAALNCQPNLSCDVCPSP